MSRNRELVSLATISVFQVIIFQVFVHPLASSRESFFYFKQF